MAEVAALWGSGPMGLEVAKTHSATQGPRGHSDGVGSLSTGTRACVLKQAASAKAATHPSMSSPMSVTPQHALLLAPSRTQPGSWEAVEVVEGVAVAEAVEAAVEAVVVAVAVVEVAAVVVGQGQG